MDRRRLLQGAVTGGAAVAMWGEPAVAARDRRPKRELLPDPDSISVADPAELSLTEAAALLQAKRLSSTELTQACLGRAASHDGAITAWVRIYPEVALDFAGRADQRLSRSEERRRRRNSPLVCGIPLALKDLFAARGLPLTASSRVLEGNIATGDSDVWQRLRYWGMVLMGHAHTDEFAFGVGTPQTGNPWDPSRSPGGSSGGSGAVLGARMVPAATGTDTGGSLRLPASACGVTTIKPTYGLVSTYGVIPLIWSRDHAGPMARSAADVSLLLSYMAGADQDDPATLAPPRPSTQFYPLRPTRGSRPLSGKRFGVPSGVAEAIPAALGDLFGSFLSLVRRLGGEVVEVTMPPISGLGLGEAAETGQYHQQFGPDALPRYRPDLGAIVAAAIAAQGSPVSVYLDDQRTRRGYQQAYNRLFAEQRLHAVLYPGAVVDGATRSELAGLTIFSEGVGGDVFWANQAGVPAVCTPVGRSSATGIPFGVQIGGLPHDEAGLLQTAIDVQAHQPVWRDAPPLAPSPRDIPSVRPTETDGDGDPTGTDARLPALRFIATRSSRPDS